MQRMEPLSFLPANVFMHIEWERMEGALSFVLNKEDDFGSRTVFNFIFVAHILPRSWKLLPPPQTSWSTCPPSRTFNGKALQSGNICFRGEIYVSEGAARSSSATLDASREFPCVGFSLAAFQCHDVQGGELLGTELGVSWPSYHRSDFFPNAGVRFDCSPSTDADVRIWHQQPHIKWWTHSQVTQGRHERPWCC